MKKHNNKTTCLPAGRFNNLFRGNITTGTIYIVAILALLTIFGTVMTKGLLPPESHPTGPAVTIVPPKPSPGQNNLQLYTFGYTTPAPTTEPTPPDEGPYCKRESTQKAPRTCQCQPGENDWVFCKENPCGATDPYDIAIGNIEPGNWGIPPDYTCAYTKEGGNPLYESKKSDPNCVESCVGKPVIYLYPENPTLVDVLIQTPGRIYISDPLYPTGGWKNVLAFPDGRLIYQSNEYKELYYETEVKNVNAPSTGIIIARGELKEKLSEYVTMLGLIKHEKDEFLEYWLPKLDGLNSPYVLFSILDRAEKERIDSVHISEQPDTFIDFIAYFKPLSEKTDITPLAFPDNPPVRRGFTAVEWGGTIAY